MNKFDEKLNKLIKEAYKSGYELKKGKFKLSTPDKFPVMEVFIFKETTEEEYGYFNIYKETVKISNEDYQRVLKYAEHNSCEDITDENEKEDFAQEFFEITDDVINKYVKLYRISDFYLGYKDSIRIWSDEDYPFEYRNHEGETKYADFYFNRGDYNSRFPTGYISFYEILQPDFEKVKEQDIDLELTKFVREN